MIILKAGHAQRVDLIIAAIEPVEFKRLLAPFAARGAAVGLANCDYESFPVGRIRFSVLRGEMERYFNWPTLISIGQQLERCELLLIESEGLRRMIICPLLRNNDTCLSGPNGTE